MIISTPINQTMTGFLGRTFWWLDDQTVLFAGRIMSGLVVILTVVACVPMGEHRDYLVREYALIVAAIHMIAPFTWYLQLVLIHLPLLVVVMVLVESGRYKTLTFFGTLFVLSNIHGLLWHQISGTVGNGWWMSTPLFLTLSLWAFLAKDIMSSKLSASCRRWPKRSGPQGAAT